MAHGRLLIRSLVFFFFVKASKLHSFYFGGSLACHHLSCYPRRQSLLFVDENEDINGHTHANQDIQHRVSLLQHQQNWQRHHQESHVTAAGAESLFSISLWSLSSKALSTPTKKDGTQFVDFTEQADLPSIDCEWACHSDEETIHLQQMKLLLEIELQAVVKKELHLLYPDVYSDLRLLRFLRKNKERDIISSAERYRSFLKWRDENNVDKIRAMVESNHAGVSSFTPPDDRLQAVAKYFPMKFDYIVGSSTESDDKEGCVQPAILYVGSFDTLGISERIMSPQSNISLDDFLDYWVYLYESIHFHLYQQSIHCGEMMFLDEVCDLSGLSIQQFSPYFVTKIMKPWLRMTQSNYPETTRRIYVLNPPTLVNVAWKLVAPLISQGTLDKIRFEKKFQGTADDFCNDHNDV